MSPEGSAASWSRVVSRREARLVFYLRQRDVLLRADVHEAGAALSATAPAIADHVDTAT